MTDTATATKKIGKKMCESCGTSSQVGGNDPSIGDMAKLCLKCIVAKIRRNTCPLCDDSFTSAVHIDKCRNAVLEVPYVSKEKKETHA